MARGLVVVGVVVNHVLDGLIGADLLDPQHPVAVANNALYVFRMPALAFLLGLFIPGGVAKRGTRGYVRDRVALMLYLYLLWHLIQATAEVLTSGLKNTPRGWGTLVTVWVPIAHLWFLPFLAVATVVIATTRPWQSPGRAVAVLGSLGALSVTLWGWQPYVVGLDGLSLLVFAAAGACVGRERLSRWLTLGSSAWAGAGLAALSGFAMLELLTPLVPATRPDTPALGAAMASLTGAALGIFVVLAVSVLLSRVALLTRAFAALGTRTMPIYLAHVILAAGVRIVLVRVGVDDTAVIAIVAIAVGVLAPHLLGGWATRRPRAGWVFELPFWIRGRLAASGTRRSQPSGRRRASGSNADRNRFRARSSTIDSSAARTASVARPNTPVRNRDSATTRD